MPTGKAHIRGARIDRPDLTGLDVRLDYLEAHRRLAYRLPTGEPTSETVASIRYAVGTYVGSHRTSPPMTLTDRRKILRHLARLVRRAIKSPNDADAVRDAEAGLKRLDLNTRDELYRFLMVGGSRTRPVQGRGCLVREDQQVAGSGYRRGWRFDAQDVRYAAHGTGGSGVPGHRPGAASAERRNAHRERAQEPGDGQFAEARRRHQSALLGR